jgi:DNA topoisomerase VI subunit A
LKKYHLILSESVEQFEMPELKFILICEKETIFYRLIDEQSPYLLSNSLIITAKGYPD